MTSRLLALLLLLATPALAAPSTGPQTGHAAIMPLAEVADVVAYSPGGLYKVTGSEAGRMELWRLGHDNVSWSSCFARNFPGAIATLAVNDRGTVAAGSTNGLVEIFTPSADKWERTFWEVVTRDQAITALVLSQTDYLALGAADGVYRVYQRRHDGTNWTWMTLIDDRLLGAISALTVTEAGTMAIGGTDGRWDYWFPSPEDEYWYVQWDPTGNGISALMLDDTGWMAVARNDGVFWVYAKSGDKPEDLVWNSVLNWQLDDGHHATTIALAKGQFAALGTDQGLINLFTRDVNPTNVEDPWECILTDDFPGQDPVVEAKFLPGPKLEARSESGAVWRWAPNAAGVWELLAEGSIELSE